MTATQQFIEDAIKGGWDDLNYAYGTDTPKEDDIEVGSWYYDSRVLLDPLAWQAVGRTRVWGHGRERLNWKNNWLAFIQYLADGKSIEESLTAITN